MYQPQPPSIQHFSPDISRQPRMPSPPSCLRSLVNRLNKPPTPSPKTTLSRHEPNPPLASHQSDRDQESQPTTKALQSYPYAGSTTSSSEPPEVNQGPEISQLLSHFFGTGNNLDLAECKIEVHLHMHANPRPAFPPPYSQHERLKRKREATSHGRECDDDGEGAERSAKKVKLSHGGEVQRVPSEDGRNLPTGDSNRSRTRTRRMTSRQRSAERRKHLRGY